MTLEGARLLELHRSVSVASGMSHHVQSQTAVRYNSQFLTKQKQIQVWQLQNLSGFYELMPNDSVQSSCQSNVGDMCIHSKMTVQCKTQVLHKLFEGIMCISYGE